MEPIQQIVKVGTEAMNDDNWIKWTFGGVIALCGAIWSHVVHSNGSMWRAMEKQRDDITKHKADTASFREMVARDLPTKSDLKTLEERLIAAIKERREVWPRSEGSR